MNLYGFVGNDGVNDVDLYGLSGCDILQKADCAIRCALTGGFYLDCTPLGPIKACCKCGKESTEACKEDCMKDYLDDMDACKKWPKGTRGICTGAAATRLGACIVGCEL